MRFYLIDKVIEIDYRKSIIGIKCWTLTDEIFSDHFPGFPVVPGVLLVESTAQLLGMLIGLSYKKTYPEKGEVYAILSIIHKAKFRTIVVPGDRCEIRGVLKSIDYSRATGSAEIFVEGKLVAQTELSFTLILKSAIPNTKDLDKGYSEYFEIVSRGIIPIE